MASPNLSNPNNSELYHFISWTPPSDQSWRINFAGYVNGSKKAGAGCILRDQNAKFKAACAVPVMNCNNLVGAELTGLKHGLVMAIKQGVDYLEIEGDYSPAMRLLFGEVSIPLSSKIYQLVDHCSYLLNQFRSVKIREVNIDINSGANEVATIGICLKNPKQWLDEPPSEISEILITDVIGRKIYKFMP
ncbi:hypothetical protein ACOSP7_028635 [Xanthoceras sorbifolium]